MLEDDPELGLVRLELLVTQIEPGQSGHMGDVDVYRHEAECKSRKRSSYHPVLARQNALVAEGNRLKGTAIALGAIGIVAMVAGLVAILLVDPREASPTGGVLVRVGAVLGALALVLPGLRKPSLSTALIAGAGLVLVMARPGLVWAALIGWAAWVLLSRQRRTSRSDS